MAKVTAANCETCRNAVKITLDDVGFAYPLCFYLKWKDAAILAWQLLCAIPRNMAWEFCWNCLKEFRK